MPTPEEELCCRRKDGFCLQYTAAEPFNKYILDRGALHIAIANRNDLFAMDEMANIANLRKAAYRQFVHWKCGHLGSGNRVVVSCCAVWCIRNTFLSSDGQYLSYKVSRLG